MLAHIIYKKIGKSRSIKVLDRNFFVLSGKAASHYRKDTNDPLIQLDCCAMQ